MYPSEKRYRAIVHYEHFLRSFRKVAKVYGVSKSTVHRWVRSTPVKRRRTRKQVKEQVVDCIQTTLRENPMADLHQVCEAIGRDCKLKRSVRTTGRTLRSLDYTRKKVFTTVDHQSSPDVMSDFCRRYNAVRAGDLVAIDEAGFYVGDHGRHGYSKRGQRIHVPASRTLRRTKFTLLMAISRVDVVHFEVLDHNCRKADFERFIRGIPCPEGKTLLMDNVRFHHSTETKKAIADIGCRVLYIPPYSPRFNAIEYAFSALKRLYRRQCTAEGITRTNNPEDYLVLLHWAVMAPHDYSVYFDHVGRSVAYAMECGCEAVSGYDGARVGT